MSRFVLGLVVLLAATSFQAPSSAAVDEKTALARQHTRQAETLFKVDRFAEALREYQEAYVNVPDATFLFNIAQCYRLMGKSGDALRFYRRYLQDRPDAPNRASVERQMKELESSRDGRAEPEAPPARSTPTRPPSPSTSRPVAAIAPPPVLDAPRPAPPSTTGAPLVLGAAPARDEAGARPFYSRWWFWTAVGVAVVGGTVAALAASGGGGGSPACPAGVVCK